MAGGTWLNQNKTLPGVYTNFAISRNSGNISRKGVVSLALSLSWFEAQKMMRITKDNYNAYIGYLGNGELALIEAFKNASEVLLYKLNAGTAATATIGNLIVTAAYGGTFGNNIKVVVETVVGETGKYYVSTYIGTKEYDKQKVSDASQLKNNSWVKFTYSETALSETAATSLSGGSDGTVAVANYVSYLSQLELYEFNAVACTSNDDDVKTLYIDFAKKLITEEGRYFQLVLADAEADFEAIISIKNGVTLYDGTVVSKEVACAYVAGATATVELSKSLTNAEYIGAVDVSERYSTAQQASFADSGQLIFIPSLDNKVYIQKDINTLVTLSENRNDAYKKNKIIRTIYSVASELNRIAKESFIGKVTNNNDGRNLLKSAILIYLRELVSQSVINDVTSSDITIQQGVTTDSVVITYAIVPIDTIDVIYNTIVISV